MKRGRWGHQVKTDICLLYPYTHICLQKPLTDAFTRPTKSRDKSPLYTKFTMPKQLYNYDPESSESSGAHQNSANDPQSTEEVY